MKMKDVVAATGLSEKTIRYYEIKGLIAPHLEYRNGRNYHDFSDADVQMLCDVVTLRHADFSIEEILQMQKRNFSIAEILTNYQERIKNKKETYELLHEISNTLGSANFLDISEVATYIRNYSSEVPTVEKPIEFHFGVDDVETDDEKAAAIQAFWAKKEPRYHVWIIAILSALNIAMLICLLFLLPFAKKAIPETTGATGDYLYYLSGINFVRCDANGENETVIYQRTDANRDFSYVVGTDKIYFLDGTQLYSINYDGSGKYKFSGTYAGPPAGRHSKTWSALALHDEMLYACYSRGGMLGSPERKMACISTETGKISYIDSDYASSVFGIYDGKLYIYDTYAPTTGIDIIDLETGKCVQSVDTEFDAEGVWFYNGAAYFSVSTGNGSDLVCITEDDLDGVIVDHCGSWYYGGYQNYCICSDGGAGYVKNMISGAKTNIPIMTNIAMDDTMIILSDENSMKYLSLPIQ